MAEIPEVNNRQFSLNDIISATNNFADGNFTSEGGSGRVYKGQIHPHGTLVSVKRLNLRNTISGREHNDEFLKEIVTLASYKHDNLVYLLGFCDEDDENILVYKQEANGSLYDNLKKTSLTWEQRLRICLGAARGLDYLHELEVLHCDIKSSNILLDMNWEAKIGLPKIGLKSKEGYSLVTMAADTFGYVDPLYLITGMYRKESDVYSLGMVLFQVLGKLAVNEQDLDESSTTLIQINKYSLQIFKQIAYKCVHTDQRKRPTMKIIIQELEVALKFQIGCAELLQTRLWGSRTCGDLWSFTLKRNEKLKKVTIDHDDWIHSIEFFAVDNIDGSLPSTQKYGGVNGTSKGKISKIYIHADEEIVGISGAFNIHYDLLLISSLTFVTTKGMKGPFGKVTGLKTETYFSESWDKSLFAGFHGRSASYIDGIGCCLKLVVDSEFRNITRHGELVRTELWGSSSGGLPWSFIINENLKLSKMFIYHEDWIYSIGFMVKHADSYSSKTYGYHSKEFIASEFNKDNISEITFDADEEIVGISGTSNKHEGYQLISSLYIMTNKKLTGCFGKQTGKDSEIHFSKSWDVGSFAGFYGRSGLWMDGIGCCLKSVAGPGVQINP